MIRFPVWQHAISKIFFICFVLFLGMAVANKNASLVTAIISLPLIFFYPGYYLSRAWKKGLAVATRISLSVVFSVALHLALLTVLKNYITLNPESLSTYLLGVNALIAILFWGLFSKNQESDIAPYTRKDYAIILTPLLFFLINFAIAPLVSEGDSYYFIYAAVDSFAAGMDVSPYINRPGFIPFLGLLHLAGGEDFTLIFRLLLPLLFYASLLMAIDYIRTYSKNYNLSRWLYLLFIAVPVVTTEVDIARTQSLVFAFTIPVLIFLSEYLAKNKLSYLIAATLLAGVGTRIHELSYVLLLTCLVTGAIQLVRYLFSTPNRKKAFEQTLKIVALAALVIYPYYVVLLKDHSFTFIQSSSNGILNTILHPQWTWWFLSSYTSDGHQLGWPGTQAVLFYLYNGILLAGFALVLWITTKRKVSFPLLFPSLFFTFIYVAVAEILPRMNLFFYPNRAWPHLMIGLAMIIVSSSMVVTWRFKHAARITAVVFLILLASGIAGWVKLTFDKGGFYVKEEIAVRNFIRDKLPSEAVVFTTQASNQAIISIYGKKSITAISSLINFTHYEDFTDTVIQTQQKTVAITVSTEPYLRRTLIENKNGEVLSQEIQILPPKYIRIPDSTNLDSPLYFYYSFARFNGYMGQRDWWRAVNNYQNYDFFKNYPEEDVVYKDDAGIIIKMK